MNDISNEQKLEFAHKEFPGKAVNLGDGNWWYIQMEIGGIFRREH